jgi:hypothetical protein
MEMHFFFEVRIERLNINQMNFGFKRILYRTINQSTHRNKVKTCKWKTLTGSCERGNEHSDCMKSGDFSAG